MPSDINLHTVLNQFRLAGRSLFNEYFRDSELYTDAGWVAQERFAAVEAMLFQKLVIETSGLAQVPYGYMHPGIAVQPKASEPAPIMVNREVDSGYWDHPLYEVTSDTRLLFMCFFDWDLLDYRDNRYVRVLIEKWPGHPEVRGKHALIESPYVRFLPA